MRKAWIALLLLVCSLSSSSGFAQSIQEQAARPPPLPPEAGCELWRGTVSGNDPSVLVEARFCPEGARVRGVLQWSSAQSGWNRRSIDGAWDAARTRLSLRDLAVLEQRPQPGWHFCTVDRYELTLSSPSALTGTYDSVACRDHATVNLQLVSTEAARPADIPPPATPPPPLLPPPPTGCAMRCGLTPPTAGATLFLPPLALLALALVARPRERGTSS